MGTELLEAARQLKQERSFVPAPVPSAAVESDPEPGRSGLSRVMNHPWVVSVVGGLLVAGIVAVIALLR